MATIGKALICIGLAVIIVGALLWLSSKLGIGLGKLPGDIMIEKGKSSFYFPITTSIIISIILTIILNLIYFLKK